MELITPLKEIPNLEIIAFDAPGNGSSEGELSNLLLYIEAVKAVISHFGKPDVLIGHSLGATANILALRLMELCPTLLISLTPLIRLQENFEATMNSAKVSPEAQENFLQSFEALFGKPASYYNLIDLYNLHCPHWLAYDEEDLVSPYAYMEEFLNLNPAIERKSCNGVGHERILKSAEMIGDVVEMVKQVVQSQ